MRRVSTAFIDAVASTNLRIRSTRPHSSICARNSSFLSPQPQLSSLRCNHVVPAKRERIGHIIASAKTQQETAWNNVSVIENSEACEDHHYIVINVGTTFEKGSLCDSYRVPGMFVQMREGEGAKAGFFAISCGPNVQGVFEFLIKRTEGTEWLCDVKEGETVQMSGVMGKGFGMGKLDVLRYPAVAEEDKAKDILLFATGSGIAPIRAAIEGVLNGVNVGGRRSVKLFYGARYAERMAYMDRFGMWEEDGVEVIPVMSRPGEGGSEWKGKTGYIQEVLKEVGISAPRQTGALLCGVKGMTVDVKEILVEAGVPEERVLMNF